MLDMHIRPSDLMGIDDVYTAFCFDEACAYIVSQLKDGKEPVFQKGKDSKGDIKCYSKPSDLYNRFKN